jgi:hypothetical protein
MIRRDVQLAGGRAAWALVSQIEHARISGELARRATGQFTQPALAAVRREVLAAIACHDDGWAAWERSPRLDPERGRPLSFMELEPAEAVTIWNRSIAAAEAHGPLAAWMVAGHFARLLKHSDSAHDDPAARRWLDATRRAQQAWLAAWTAADPLHTPQLAEQALQWLWTFDEASLWLCCACPAGDEPSKPARPYVAGRATPLEMMLAPASNEAAFGAATATPWNFDREAFELEVAAIVAPRRRYDDWRQLQLASHSCRPRWRLAAAAPL